MKFFFSFFLSSQSVKEGAMGGWKEGRGRWMKDGVMSMDA